MLLRAGLIHLGLPVYLAFLRERRSSAQTPPAAPQWRTPAPLTPVPAVSIIIPVYKVERYLDTCVQSVLDQTFQDIEILLVDDGSPDRCPEMCDAWAKRTPACRSSTGRTVVFPLRATPASRPPAAVSSLWTATTSGAGRRPPRCGRAGTHRRGAGHLQPRLRRRPRRTVPRSRISAAFGMKYSTRTASGRGISRWKTKKSTIPSLGISCNRKPFCGWPALCPRASGMRISSCCPTSCTAARTIVCLGYRATAMCSGQRQHHGAGPGRNYLDRPEYLLEWCGYFTEKGDYLRAEGLLNDAINNLAEKQGFDLTTAQQARYRQACRDCSTAYGTLARRTGQRSMLLRAGLCCAWVCPCTNLSQTQNLRSSAQWKKHNCKKVPCPLRPGAGLEPGRPARAVALQGSDLALCQARFQRHVQADRAGPGVDPD